MNFTRNGWPLLVLLACLWLRQTPVYAQEASPKKTTAPEKTAQEQKVEKEKAEKALKEAERDINEAEDTRREAVSQLKAEGSTRDWAKDVSEEEQAKANKILLEGNALLRESFFSQAVAKYSESLKHWNHPGTHYNMALAMLTLDDPLTTHYHLIEATKFGPEPLEQDKYDYALNYLALLNKQVTTLRVSCEEPGAEVRLDGRYLFRAPSSYEGLVLRGEHSVTASKPGFEVTQITKRIDSDAPVDIKLKLYRPDDLYVYTRPYPLWIPISVAAAGAVIAGGGGLATYLAQQSYDDFDQAVKDDPTCVRGCEPSGDAESSLNKGDTLRTLGIVGFAAGGAIFAAGVTLLVLDSETSRRVTPEERQGVSLVPLFGPGMAGFVGTGHF